MIVTAKNPNQIFFFKKKKKKKIKAVSGLYAAVVT